MRRSRIETPALVLEWDQIDEGEEALRVLLPSGDVLEIVAQGLPEGVGLPLVLGTTPKDLAIDDELTLPKMSASLYSAAGELMFDTPAEISQAIPAGPAPVDAWVLHFPKSFADQKGVTTPVKLRVVEQVGRYFVEFDSTQDTPVRLLDQGATVALQDIALPDDDDVDALANLDLEDVPLDTNALAGVLGMSQEADGVLPWSDGLVLLPDATTQALMTSDDVKFGIWVFVGTLPDNRQVEVHLPVVKRDGGFVQAADQKATAVIRHGSQSKSIGLPSRGSADGRWIIPLDAERSFHVLRTVVDTTDGDVRPSRLFAVTMGDVKNDALKPLADLDLSLRGSGEIAANSPDIEPLGLASDGDVQEIVLPTFYGVLTAARVQALDTVLIANLRPGLLEGQSRRFSLFQVHSANDLLQWGFVFEHGTDKGSHLAAVTVGGRQVNMQPSNIEEIEPGRFRFQGALSFGRGALDQSTAIVELVYLATGHSVTIEALTVSNDTSQFSAMGFDAGTVNEDYIRAKRPPQRVSANYRREMSRAAPANPRVPTRVRDIDLRLPEAIRTVDLEIEGVSAVADALVTGEGLSSEVWIQVEMATGSVEIPVHYNSDTMTYELNRQSDGTLVVKFIDAEGGVARRIIWPRKVDRSFGLWSLPIEDGNPLFFRNTTLAGSLAEGRRPYPVFWQTATGQAQRATVDFRLQGRFSPTDTSFSNGQLGDQGVYNAQVMPEAAVVPENPEGMTFSVMVSWQGTQYEIPFHIVRVPTLKRPIVVPTGMATILSGARTGDQIALTIFQSVYSQALVVRLEARVPIEFEVTRRTVRGGTDHIVQLVPRHPGETGTRTSLRMRRSFEWRRDSKGALYLVDLAAGFAKDARDGYVSGEVVHRTVQDLSSNEFYDFAFAIERQASGAMTLNLLGFAGFHDSSLWYPRYISTAQDNGRVYIRDEASGIYLSFPLTADRQNLQIACHGRVLDETLLAKLEWNDLPMEPDLFEGLGPVELPDIVEDEEKKSRLVPWHDRGIRMATALEFSRIYGLSVDLFSRMIEYSPDEVRRSALYMSHPDGLGAKTRAPEGFFEIAYEEEGDAIWEIGYYTAFGLNRRVGLERKPYVKFRGKDVAFETQARAGREFFILTREFEGVIFSDNWEGSGDYDSEPLLREILQRDQGYFEGQRTLRFPSEEYDLAVRKDEARWTAIWDQVEWVRMLRFRDLDVVPATAVQGSFKEQTIRLARVLTGDPERFSYSHRTAHWALRRLLDDVEGENFHGPVREVMRAILKGQRDRSDLDNLVRLVAQYVPIRDTRSKESDRLFAAIRNELSALAGSSPLLKDSETITFDGETLLDELTAIAPKRWLEEIEKADVKSLDDLYALVEVHSEPRREEWDSFRARLDAFLQERYLAPEWRGALVFSWLDYIANPQSLQRPGNIPSLAVTLEMRAQAFADARGVELQDETVDELFTLVVRDLAFERRLDDQEAQRVAAIAKAREEQAEQRAAAAKEAEDAKMRAEFVAMFSGQGAIPSWLESTRQVIGEMHEFKEQGIDQDRRDQFSRALQVQEDALAIIKTRYHEICERFEYGDPRSYTFAEYQALLQEAGVLLKSIPLVGATLAPPFSGGSARVDSIEVYGDAGGANLLGIFEFSDEILPPAPSADRDPVASQLEVETSLVVSGGVEPAHSRAQFPNQIETGTFDGPENSKATYELFLPRGVRADKVEEIVIITDSPTPEAWREIIRRNALVAYVNVIAGSIDHILADHHPELAKQANQILGGEFRNLEMEVWTPTQPSYGPGKISDWDILQAQTISLANLRSVLQTMGRHDLIEALDQVVYPWMMVSTVADFETLLRAQGRSQVITAAQKGRFVGDSDVYIYRLLAMAYSRSQQRPMVYNPRAEGFFMLRLDTLRMEQGELLSLARMLKVRQQRARLLEAQGVK